jgi:hypothetical protein
MCNRRKAVCLLALAVFSFAAIMSAIAQEKRAALVIGNAAYKTLPALKNSVNDAIDMADKLSALGFDVIKITDATQESMESAVRQFGAKLAGSDVGLFYYSGHGVQSGGVNYLVPVDADVKTEMDLKYKTVQADFVLDYMSNSGSKLNIVILDACRDNPFSGFRTATRGLAVISAPRGSLVVYSTSPGSVAEDGMGRNGTFTAALLKNIATQGLDMKQVFDNVGKEVQGATGGKQVPWVLSSYFGTFQFAPASSKAVASAPTSAGSGSGMMIVQKTYGSIQVEVKMGGSVFVDGAEKGELTPGVIGTISGVEVGSHTVEVRYADGAVERNTLSVERDKTAAASFTHAPSAPSAAVQPQPAPSTGAAAKPQTASSAAVVTQPQVAPSPSAAVQPQAQVPAATAQPVAPSSTGAMQPKAAPSATEGVQPQTASIASVPVQPQATPNENTAESPGASASPQPSASAGTEPGIILLDWLPKGSMVSLDGKALSIPVVAGSRFLIDNLSPKQYSLAVTIPDAGIFNSSVTVDSGQIATVSKPSSFLLTGYQAAKTKNAASLTSVQKMRGAGWISLSVGAAGAIGAGVFFLLGGAAHTSYAAATSDADATSLRSLTETYAYLLSGSAILSGLGLLGGAGLEITGPSPASLKEKMQELDLKISALSDEEAGQ